MTSALVLTLLFAFAPVAADHAWQDGTLTDVTSHNTSAQVIEPQIGTGTGDRTIRYSVTYEYTIQTADRFYVAQIQTSEQGSTAPVAVPPVDLDTNARVTFAVDKQTLYVKDKKGKEHKLRIVKQGIRQPGTPNSQKQPDGV
jgi:hypothetical protein